MSIEPANGKAVGPSWILPTAYPENENGVNGNKESDFLSLEKDGVLEVVIGLQRQWFWVPSPKSPYYQTITLDDPDAQHGINYDYSSGDGSISVFCVKHMGR